MYDHVTFNPHYNRGYAMIEQVIRAHSDELLRVQLNFFEHKDTEGVVYQISPWLDVQFKGF